MAKWAVALRTAGSPTEPQIEAALDAGDILRTHLMRPTWHFVAAQDIRMVLQATASRVHQANAFVYRSRHLGPARLARFTDRVRDLLAGGNHLTRKEVLSACPRDLVEEDGIAQAYLFMYAELEAVICSGPRRGKQMTYALLDERVPSTPPMSEEEARVALVRRYLATRGPATVADLTTWSGLTVAQARAAIADLGDEVTAVDIGAPAYVLGESPPPGRGGRTTFLMPDFDEYGMAYKDRSAIVDASRAFPATPWNRVVVVDGVVAGYWRRTLGATTVTVELHLPDLPVDDARVVVAAREYAAFVGRELVIGPAAG